jgi:ribonuclease HI
LAGWLFFRRVTQVPARRKKKVVRVIHPSVGPLPLKLAGGFAGFLLVFSDASCRRHGGLAAVLFDDHEGEPLVATRTVAPGGSNELELSAAIFALEEAARLFPGRALALFSDNSDAVARLARAATLGLAQDAALQALCGGPGVASALASASFCWVRGHATCRGNTLADLHAAAAAS